MRVEPGFEGILASSTHLLVNPAGLTQEVLDSWLQERDKSAQWKTVERPFVALLKACDPSVSPLVQLLGALTSHVESRQAVCLELDALWPESGSTFLGTGEAGDDVHTLVAQAADLLTQHGVTLASCLEMLSASRVVAVAHAGEAHFALAPLVLVGQRLYLWRYYHAEREMATRLGQRLTHRSEKLDPALEGLLAQLFNRPNSVGQQQACKLALESRFAVITGGPGTGKTSTVARLLLVLLRQAQSAGKPGLRIRLAAPTGKAAARVTESLGRELLALRAQLGHEPWFAEVERSWPDKTATLHRLLGSRPGTTQFRHTRSNPLHADVVVVDEASMISVDLMWSLLDAMPDEARLVLLGDKDQLASVEAGNCMAELCRLGSSYEGDEATNSSAGPRPSTPGGEGAAPAELTRSRAVAVLDYSHRFPNESHLGRLAKAVQEGDLPRGQQLLDVGLGQGLAELQWLRLGKVDHRPLEDTVVEGCRAWLPLTASLEAWEALDPSSQRAWELDWMARQQDWAQAVLQAHASFQVLTATRGGDWGVEALNGRFAHVLKTTGLIERDRGWYCGRPVMVTRNDYTTHLMNGDIGITLPVRTSPQASPELRVAFRHTSGMVTFVPCSRLTHIETVFAMTVHKSQGSEFDNVVLVLPPEHQPLLTRELLYTGLTRTKVRYHEGKYVSGRFTLVSHTADVLKNGAGVPIGDGVLHATVQARTRRASGLYDQMQAYLSSRATPTSAQA